MAYINAAIKNRTNITSKSDDQPSRIMDLPHGKDEVHLIHFYKQSSSQPNCEGPAKYFEKILHKNQGSKDWRTKVKITIVRLDPDGVYDDEHSHFKNLTQCNIVEGNTDFIDEYQI